MQLIKHYLNAFNYKQSLILAILLSLSLPVSALKGDTEQPINIQSGSQSFDMEKNVLVLNDNVVITQGTIKLNADKVTVKRKEGQKEEIDANGSPVTFQQTLDNGKLVNGKAAVAHYDLANEFLVLTGNAELKQQDSFVTADKITYDVKKQQLKAMSNTKGRVKTILIPTQLQENSSKK